MHIKIERDVVTPQFTCGKLFIDGVFYCYTLEDPIREKKVYAETAIPHGKYSVVISRSNTFKKDLPEVLNVPGYSGVRIHSGNTIKDTKGCPLVGSVRDTAKGIVSGGSKVMPDFMKRLQDALAAGKKVDLEIVDATTASS